MILLKFPKKIRKKQNEIKKHYFSYQKIDFEFFWKTTLEYYCMNFDFESFLSAIEQYFLIPILYFYILQFKVDRISYIVIKMICTLQISLFLQVN